MIASQLLLFVTPIFYATSIVPQPFRAILQLNPLTSIVDNFRRVLLWNQQPDWLTWFVGVFGCACAAYVGYLWFIKTQPGFAEVL
jgi:lipopolysaccharide transport system permease protein